MKSGITTVVAKSINDIYFLSCLLNNAILYFNTEKYDNHIWSIKMAHANHEDEMQYLSTIKIHNIQHYNKTKNIPTLSCLQAITTDHKTIFLHLHDNKVNFKVSNLLCQVVIDENTCV